MAKRSQVPRGRRQRTRAPRGAAQSSSLSVVGVVLAGGASRRLGEDKTLLQVERGGRHLTLVAWAVERLRRITDEIVVAGGDRSLADLGIEEAEHVKAAPDGPGRGPVAGLLGAATAHPHRPLLLLACDLPRVPVEVLSHLAQSRGDWVVPSHGRHLEVTCALYRIAALSRLAGLVARGELSLRALADQPQLEMQGLTAADLGIGDDWDEVFLNLNQPQDVARLRRLESAPGGE